uniref:Transposase n=1 Tax=Heligmosomoides polygyrus TaxID=6339 RepID=A0A183G2D5_HELPZ
LLLNLARRTLARLAIVMTFRGNLRSLTQMKRIQAIRRRTSPPTPVNRVCQRVPVIHRLHQSTG